MTKLIKPRRLSPGARVAVVSLSSGLLGEPECIHKFDLAKERLARDFGLELTAMPNALKGITYLYEHPEARASDLMEAFRDDSIRAVFCAIGGDDTIRLLPYVDFSVLHDHPKIFTGFSDTTTNHFMMYRAGLMSYYGASLMGTWSEYVEINPYSLDMLQKTLFHPQPTLDIPSAPYWYDEEDEKIWWKPENRNRRKPYHPEELGYELLQGGGVAEGQLLGGCLDVFPQLWGTSLWPSAEEWRGKLLFLETSEEDMPAEYLVWYLRTLQAQGVLAAISGILVGKPARRSKYEPYKEAIRKVVGFEAGRPELPILCNVNFGHAEPICLLPIGAKCRLDAERKTITLLEPATA